MSKDVSNAFIKQYEAEVHEAYQRMGSALRNTVRNKTNIQGASTTFQKVGKGEAGQKLRNGKVPVMNIDHDPVECILTDYYAGDWVDKLDELKINIDEKKVIVNAGAYALGRKTDDLIITELAAASGGQVIAHGAAGLTLPKILQGFELHGTNDVPDDGERYAVIGWKQWSQLLQIDEFANADYVGTDDYPWLNGGQAKKWLNTLWMPHSGLPVATNIRSCFWYHKTAIGHASGAEVQTDISWHGDYAAHFVNSMMSQGAKMIDELGVVEIECSEA